MEYHDFSQNNKHFFAMNCGWQKLLREFESAKYFIDNLGFLAFGKDMGIIRSACGLQPVHTNQILQSAAQTIQSIERTCITLRSELQCDKRKHKNASRPGPVNKHRFRAGSVLTTFLTTNKFVTSEMARAKDVQKVHCIKTKASKSTTNCHNKYPAPLWDHDAAGSNPVTRTKKETSFANKDKRGFLHLFATL